MKGGTLTLSCTPTNIGAQLLLNLKMSSGKKKKKRWARLQASREFVKTAFV